MQEKQQTPCPHPTTLKLLSLRSSLRLNPMGNFQSSYISIIFRALLTSSSQNMLSFWFLEYHSLQHFSNLNGFYFTVTFFSGSTLFLLYPFDVYQSCIIHNFNKQPYKASSAKCSLWFSPALLSPLLKIFALIFVSIFLNSMLFLDLSILDFQPRKMSI